jgi:hypothetical protein
MRSFEAAKGIVLYNTWNQLRLRCNGKTAEGRKYYVPRGIGYDPRWEDFDTFWDDMNVGWDKGLSLDRIDNNSGYSKENCRWATKKTQANNRKNAHLFTFNGDSKTLTDWSPVVNIKRSTLSMRIYASGWSIEKALTTPVQ